MNYDEFLREVRLNADVVSLSPLEAMLSSWKSNSSTVNDLAELVEDFFRQANENNELYDHLYSEWLAFRKNAIDNIGGLTMNERLYYFGMSERFEKALEADERSLVHTKLLARP